MLKKLMSSIVISTLLLGMVGCSNPETNSNGSEDHTKVEEKVDSNEKQEKQQESTKKVNKKEDAAKEDNKKDNDEELPAGAVKDGTHLQEEADKQDKEMQDSNYRETCPECGKPVEDCICDGDGNTYEDDNSNYNDVYPEDEDVDEDVDNTSERCTICGGPIYYTSYGEARCDCGAEH